MKDCECVDFLQWALPRMRMRWQGFRKVRRQVCKRITKRMHELSLRDVSAYRDYLECHADEWSVLDALCTIPISRFYRDRDVFDYLRSEILPSLADAVVARGDHHFRCWSCGCASGEEVYTLKIIWQLCIARRFPDLPLHITATDMEPTMLARSAEGCYSLASLKDFPAEWLGIAFYRSDALFCIRDEFRRGIEFQRQDVRKELPPGPFQLILCRHVVFTYFNEPLHIELLERMIECLVPGGVLVIGKQELLPGEHRQLAILRPRMGVYQKIASGPSLATASCGGIPTQ